MFKRITFVLALLLIMLPFATQAETVKGRLGSFSFQKGLVEVSGVEYTLNTSTTQVLFGSTNIGEEDLRRGDTVELIIGDALQADAGDDSELDDRPVLERVLLIRGSKEGLDS